MEQERWLLYVMLMSSSHWYIVNVTRRPTKTVVSASNLRLYHPATARKRRTVDSSDHRGPSAHTYTHECTHTL